MTTLLTAEGLSKSYGIKQLFEGATLHISAGDRLGLIGVNGSGKSTLLQVLAGIEPPDDGNVLLHDRVRVEYLPQEPPFDAQATVLEQIFAGPSPEMRTLREYESALRELESDSQNMEKQQR